MTTTEPTPAKRATEVDPSKTAKFLANLQRTVAKRDPDDAPAEPAPKPQPAPVAKPAAPVVQEIIEATPEPAKPKRTAPARNKKPARQQRDEDRVSMEINLDPGTGKRVVYVRVDKTLADRLQLIAFQNKIAGGDGPTTINDIGIEALLDWIDRYEGRAAA